MSVINKMLQELDKRDAMHGPRAVAAPDDGGLAKLVRPVRAPTPVFNRFWVSLAVLLLAALAWVIWVTWQITPRPVATDQAYQFLMRSRPPVQSSPAVASAPAGAADKTGKADQLRMAKEIVTPIDVLAPASGPHVTPRDEKGTGPVLLAAASGPQVRVPTQRATPAAIDAGRIDKRVDVTPRERAEAEFRRAMGLVNQGRMAEGMDGIRTALSLDAGYETARQTLVALLLEAKRIDEAASLLQEGLAVNPGNVGYAMLLARIYVEHGDPQRALALLQKSEPAGRANAEFQAFVAALYQRFGRHVEAVGWYQGALRLTAGIGAWWVGLGISQEALDRRQDAVESFSRAKAAGNLDAALVVFVDRRLMQLQ